MDFSAGYSLLECMLAEVACSFEGIRSTGRWDWGG